MHSTCSGNDNRTGLRGGTWRAFWCLSPRDAVDLWDRAPTSVSQKALCLALLTNELEDWSVDWRPSLRTATAKGSAYRDPGVSPCSAPGLCQAASQGSESAAARAF